MNELQSLSQIFQNRIFRIPDYQRGYAWQGQQLRDFWEDIVNLQSDRYHYTGLLSLKKLNQEEGITVILITHYMEEVIAADHVFVMDEGKMVMEGSPREIFSQVETLKKLRLDVPQATLLAHELQKKGVPLPNGILSNEELVEELCRLKSNM
jgi:hypothetical protein